MFELRTSEHREVYETVKRLESEQHCRVAFSRINNVGPRLHPHDLQRHSNLLTLTSARSP